MLKIMIELACDVVFLMGAADIWSPWFYLHIRLNNIMAFKIINIGNFQYSYKIRFDISLGFQKFVIQSRPYLFRGLLWLH